jgi:hypothetical protein
MRSRPTLGYLTACPTNLGTGMRASAMMHLPALVISSQMEKVVRAVNQLGMAVRGLFGEGSDASGSIFQISNQTTLGESEEDIIKRLSSVLNTIIEHELNARQAPGSRLRQALRQDRARVRHPPERPAAQLRRGHEPAFARPARRRPGRVPRGPARRHRPAVHRGAARAHPVRRKRASSNPPSATSCAPSFCAPSLQLRPAGFQRDGKELTGPHPIPCRMEPMNNFTPRAQQVLALARKEADRFHHNYVGTEHILLGLIKLRAGGRRERAAEDGARPGDGAVGRRKAGGAPARKPRRGSIPYTPRVKKVLALAGKEAKALNHLRRHRAHPARPAPGGRGRRRPGAQVARRRHRAHPQEILRELDPQFSGGQPRRAARRRRRRPRAPAADPRTRRKSRRPR